MERVCVSLPAAMQFNVPVAIGYARRVNDQFRFQVGVQDVIYPADWTCAAAEPASDLQLTGLDVHELLLGRLRELGLRPGEAP